MKKCGSSKVMDQLVDIFNSVSLDATTSAVKKNAPDACQPFSIRGYVADIREHDSKGCNPFGEKNYQIWDEQLKAPIDVPQFKWWSCTNCVRDIVASSNPDLREQQETSQRLNAQVSMLQLCAAVEHTASGDAEGEGSKAPMEIINLDESDIEGEVEKISPLEQLTRVATILLKEKERAKDAGGDQGSRAPIEVINLDDSDNEEGGRKDPIEVITLDDSDNETEIQNNCPLDELASLAVLLKEEESAGKGVTYNPRTLLEKKPCLSKNKHIITPKTCCRGLPYGQANNADHSETRLLKEEFVKPGERENAKRPSPFSQNTDPISRKRSKATGESSRPRQDKQKGNLQECGSGENPLL